MASDAGRWLRGLFGFMMMGFGYTLLAMPASITAIVIGGIMLITATFNWSFFARMAGLPVNGDKLTASYGEINGVPGEYQGEKNELAKDTNIFTRKRSQGESLEGQSRYRTGSTTQGGSNYGQGSIQLAGDAYKQGDTKNEGSNYQNEAGKLSEENDSEAEPGRS